MSSRWALPLWCWFYLYAAFLIVVESSPVCRLEIVGPDSHQGSVSTSFKCRGGTVTFALHQNLSHALTNLYGVQQATDNCGWEAGLCAAAICGDSSAVIADAKIIGIPAHYGSGLCISEKANITLQQAVVADIQRGPGIWVRDAAHVLIVDSILQGNSGTAGSGIRAEGTSSVTIQRAVFANNSASQRGGAVMVDGQATVSINDCSFQSNTAGGGSAGHYTGFGGAITLEGSANASITASNFTSNEVFGDNGGGAVAVAGAVTLSVASCAFQDNAATGYGIGGAMYILDFAQVSIANSQFITNKCAGLGGGGALYIGAPLRKAQARVRLTGNNTFAGNIAENENSGGGALAAGSEAAIMLVHHSTVFANNAAVWGGAVGLYDQTRLSDGGPGMVLFEGNSATMAGGALFAYKSAVCNLTAGSEFLGNSAWYGGAAEVEDSASLVLWFAVLQGNSAVGGNSSGAGVYSTGQARVELVNSSVVGNTAGSYGGGLDIVGNSTTEVRNSVIADNSAHGCGGARVSEFATMLIDQTVVTGNSAIQGGGLCPMGNSVVHLQQSSIVNNTASYGGGLYVADAPQLVMSGDGTQVMIYNNSASKAGGGSYLESSALNMSEQQRHISSNSAPHDKDIAVLPVQLSVVGNTSIAGFVSRLSSKEGLLPVTLQLSGLYGTPVEGDSIQATSDGSVMAEQTSGAGGLVHFNLKVLKPPGAHVLHFTDTTRPRVPAVNVTVQVATCSIGDVAASSGDACMTCTEGWYSLDPKNTTCDRCPANGQCPGGSVILPSAGYWHSSPRSVQMHKCLNAAACSSSRQALQEFIMKQQADLATTPGTSAAAANEAYKTAQCAEGYEGNLCVKCTVGYGVLKLYTCSRCMAPAVLIALFVMSAVALLGVIRLICHFTAADSQRQTMPVGSSLMAAGAADTRPTDLIKPLITYLQYAFIVTSINVQWPVVLAAPIKALAWFWSSTTVASSSIECLLPHNSHLPIANQKMLLGLGLPLGMFVVLLCIELLIIVIRRCRTAGHGWQHSSVPGHLARTAIVICFFFLPAVVRTIVGVFACIPLDQSVELPYIAAAVGSFWQHDLSQECAAGYHSKWAWGLGLPLLLVVCFAWPAFIALFTLTHKHNLQDEHFQQHYGFLVRSYRPRHCYWEAVVAWQTCVLVAISVFGVTLGPYYQSLILSAWLSLVMVTVLAVKPYESHLVHRIQFQSIGCLLLTSYSAQSFLPHGGLHADTITTNIIGAVVLCLNLVFLGYVLLQIVKLIDWRQVKGAVGNALRKSSQLLLQQLFGAALVDSNRNSSLCSLHCLGCMSIKSQQNPVAGMRPAFGHKDGMAPPAETLQP